MLICRAIHTAARLRSNGQPIQPNLALNRLIDSTQRSIAEFPRRQQSNTANPHRDMLNSSPSLFTKFGGKSNFRSSNQSTIPPNDLYIAHFFSNRNNSIATLQRPNGDAAGTFRAGQLGFKNANKSSSEAGYKVALELIRLIKEEADNLGKSISVELALKGFGQGREAVFKAIQGTDGDHVRRYIWAISDRTPIKFGGDRPKKRRML